MILLKLYVLELSSSVLLITFGLRRFFLRALLVKTVAGLLDDNANICAERLEEFA